MSVPIQNKIEELRQAVLDAERTHEDGLKRQYDNYLLMIMGKDNNKYVTINYSTQNLKLIVGDYGCYDDIDVDSCLKYSKSYHEGGRIVLQSTNDFITYGIDFHDRNDILDEGYIFNLNVQGIDPNHIKIMQMISTINLKPNYLLFLRFHELDKILND